MDDCIEGSCGGHGALYDRGIDYEFHGSCMIRVGKPVFVESCMVITCNPNWLQLHGPYLLNGTLLRSQAILLCLVTVRSESLGTLFCSTFANGQV